MTNYDAESGGYVQSDPTEADPSFTHTVAVVQQNGEWVVDATDLFGQLEGILGTGWGMDKDGAAREARETATEYDATNSYRTSTEVSVP